MTDLDRATPATLRRIVGRALGAVTREADPAGRVRHYARAAAALDRLDRATPIEADGDRERLASLERRFRARRQRYPAPPTRHAIPRQRAIAGSPPNPTA